MKNLLSKAKDINRLVLASKIEEMSEQEIRKNVYKTQDWEKEIKSMKTSKMDLDLEMVGVGDVDADLKDEFDDEYDKAIQDMPDLIKNLTLKDEELGLHTLAPNKGKSTVCYPDVFNGKLGENIHKFKSKFKNALEANHVRASDEVETLLKYLGGDAKAAVGKNTPSLEEAFRLLTNAYGNPHLIWKKYKEDIKKALGKYSSWGKSCSVERRNALTKMIDFINEARTLAKEYRILKNEIMSESTIELICSILPFDFQKEILDKLEENSTVDDELDAIDCILGNHLKNSNVGLKLGLLKSKEREQQKDHYEDPRSGHNVDRRDRDNHDCDKCKDCKTDWNILGCSKLYQIKKVDERRSFLAKRKKCFKCGSYYKPRQHVCKWTDKEKARCTSQGCQYAAATCKEHKNNTSQELIAWLNKANIEYVADTIIANSIPHSEDLVQQEFDVFAKTFKEGTGNFEDRVHEFMKKRKYSPNSNIHDPETRRLLQQGQVSKMMSDDEVLEFFNKDMKKQKNDVIINGIPEGEPVFVFCTLKGKKSDLQCFIDSGANCWLALDGVPQEELRSVKMCDGPIRLGVASGMTTNAKAEWASLIPLADGSFQCVRGLTLDRVTGDMPQVNLKSAMEEFRNSNKYDEKIQNIKVPDCVGGKVSMIIGIQYQSLFPTPIHTMSNGLTLFESKLLPSAPGYLGCIGGPVKCLEKICNSAGAQNTFQYMSFLVENLRNLE